MMQSDKSGIAKNMTDYEKIYDMNNLYQAYLAARKNSAWKDSVKQFSNNLLPNLSAIHNDLKNKTYKPDPVHEFVISERGHVRNIRANTFRDRVIRHSLCDNVLSPALRPYLIYDNGASLKGKGISFTRRRVLCHLQKYYRQHKSNKGYVLLIDFKSYYDSLDHEVIMRLLRERISDPDVLDLIWKIISQYNNNGKSLGIGDQTSQILGIYYPTKFDTYCKNVLGSKYFDRYMDDTLILHESKDYLWQVLEKAEPVLDDLKLTINKNKTQIHKLEKGFTFLKILYRMTETGKIYQFASKDNINRMRKKLTKFADMVADGERDYKDIENTYRSWRGNIKPTIKYKTLKDMDKRYNELFLRPFYYNYCTNF